MHVLSSQCLMACIITRRSLTVEKRERRKGEWLYIYYYHAVEPLTKESPNKAKMNTFLGPNLMLTTILLLIHS